MDEMYVAQFNLALLSHFRGFSVAIICSYRMGEDDTNDRSGKS